MDEVLAGADGAPEVILGSFSWQVKSLASTLLWNWAASDWRRLNILLCNLPILKHEITDYSVVSFF